MRNKFISGIAGLTVVSGLYISSIGKDEIKQCTRVIEDVK